MSACSDQAITLAAIAPYADGPTRITGIGHIRYQESDRIAGIASQLAKMGIRCEASDSSITIYPGSPRPSEVDTYEDHRMAMGFALTGLRSPGSSPVFSSMSVSFPMIFPPARISPGSYL